jgi:DNA mismatch repair protein MutL
MGNIHILATKVADQIAAGEVVERPASVVKELVENALDSGASTLRIEIHNGGRDSIRVSDDGSGMDRDDALLALSRHATSKIREAPDLVGVVTYGFRGEALPAIASVSRFELETKSAGNGSVGTRIVVVGGHRDEVSDTARAGGTTITVSDVFHNTPARRKFLRSQRSETRAVVDAVTVLALARPDVAFHLTSDDRVLIDAPAAESVLDRIGALFGRKTAEQLLPIEYESGYAMVRGFVQRPADVRAGGRKAHLLVNGRPFKDPFITRAAEAGYRATIPAGHRPTVLLSLMVPGDRVDVNVHPTKAEVRFRDKRFVEQTVEDAVRQSLGHMASSAVLGAGPTSIPWNATPDFSRSPFAESGGVSGLDVSFSAPSLFDDQPVSTAISQPLLQVFATYIVFETPEGIALVDQHSAHERVLYEQVMAQLRSGDGGSQRLLLPITVDLDSEELEAIDAHKDLLNAVGFETEPFGGRSVVLHAVPNPHPRFDARRCFEEMVADLARNRFGVVANRLERFAATYGCRAAVMAGHQLEQAEMRDLLNRLFACELPPHDVHGRPTIVQLPKAELERRFGRS